MAWNKPNDHDCKIDPWGKKKNNNKNNIDKKNKKNIDNKKNKPSIKNFLYKISTSIINTTNSANSSNKTIHPIVFIILIFLIVWGISGFYVVKDTDRGVVTNFGKFSYLALPGLHWKPSLISKVNNVNVDTIHQLTSSGMILTKDKNIVYINMNVKYKISNPVNYLFSTFNPDNNVREITEKTILNIIGTSKIDKILTNKKTLIEDKTKKQIKDVIKLYDMGITILDVNFINIAPPKIVKQFFDNAETARVKRKKYIKKVQLYSNEIIFEAYKQARCIITEAKHDVLYMMLEYERDKLYFYKMFPVYQMSKKFTLDHLYLESLERVLRKKRKIFTNLSNYSKFLFSLNNFFYYAALDDERDISKKNISKYCNNFFKLSPNNNLEQRRINNTIRGDLKTVEKK